MNTIITEKNNTNDLIKSKVSLTDLMILLFKVYGKENVNNEIIKATADAE